MTDKPHRKRTMTLWIILVIVIYPLTIGPLALLEGAGVLDDKAKDSIRPIYAPLRMVPPAVWVLRHYEKQCNAIGRCFHR